ncbi:kinetochore-associated Ndc80 complex subunit spc25 [Savitreella phatthalungensis]
MESLTPMAIPSLDARPLADLRAQLADFTQRFDAFVRASRESLAAERDEFIAGMAEDRSLRRANEKATEEVRVEQAELESQLAREVDERQTLAESVSVFAVRKSDIEAENTRLRTELDEVERLLKARLSQRSEERTRLARENARNIPELDALETRLGLVIASASLADADLTTYAAANTSEADASVAQRDLLRFTFTQLDPNDRAREHAIVLDLTTNKYELAVCNPADGIVCEAPLHENPSSRPQTADASTDKTTTRERISKLVDKLNVDRQFSPFLKAVRKTFRSLYL